MNYGFAARTTNWPAMKKVRALIGGTLKGTV
jgi:hypothetical protein